MYVCFVSEFIVLGNTKHYVGIGGVLKLTHIKSLRSSMWTALKLLLDQDHGCRLPIRVDGYYVP